MEIIKRYENYPIWIVIVSNLVSFAIYGLGLIIMSRLGLFVTLLYLTYILILEYRLVKYHCINCYYWGKTCGFAKGRISALFFRRGDGSKFCKKDMSWKDMIPDLLVTLIPFVIGIFLLIAKFSIFILMAIILLIIIATFGNGFIRGNLTCKFCKQRALGCPADSLFNKE